MKRFAIMCLCALILTGCAAKEVQTPGAGANTSASPQQTEREQMQQIEADVIPEPEAEEPKSAEQICELIIPASFFEDGYSQEEMDAEIAKADGFLSASQNEDGSITLVMTVEKHAQLMDEISQQIDDSLSEMIGASDTSAIVSIDANEYYTEFTVTLSTDVVGVEESVAALSFYIYGGLYNIFNGTPVDSIIVRFVDASGAIIQEAHSDDMQ